METRPRLEAWYSKNGFYDALQHLDMFIRYHNYDGGALLSNIEYHTKTCQRFNACWVFRKTNSRKVSTI